MYLAVCAQKTQLEGPLLTETKLEAGAAEVELPTSPQPNLHLKQNRSSAYNSYCGHLVALVNRLYSIQTLPGSLYVYVGYHMLYHMVNQVWCLQTHKHL